MSVDKESILPITGYPKGSLMLHSPWTRDPDSTNDYIGTIFEDDLQKCTEFTELDDKTPTILNCFLRIAKELTDASGGIWDDIDAHFHKLTHGHKKQSDGAIGDMQFDHDGGGDNTTGSETRHRHDVTLEDTTIEFWSGYYKSSEEFVKQYQEPMHQEVNAYHVKDNTNNIPIGSIVFYDHDITQSIESKLKSSGWLVVNKRSFPLPDRLGPSESWDEKYLKIVGCLPKREAQGSYNHHHVSNGHVHRNVSCAPAEPYTDLKLDTGDAGDHAANWNHYHKYINEMNMSELIGDASIAPLSVTLNILIAVEKDAKWEDGMIVPFIPSDMNGFSNLPTEFHIWPEDDRHKENYIVAVPVTKTGVLSHYGDSHHSHHYRNDHTLLIEGTLEPFTGYLINDDDDERTSSKYHRHWVHISDTFELEPAENQLKHRDVNFIRYTRLPST